MSNRQRKNIYQYHKVFVQKRSLFIIPRRPSSQKSFINKITTKRQSRYICQAFESKQSMKSREHEGTKGAFPVMAL